MDTKAATLCDVLAHCGSYGSSSSSSSYSSFSSSFSSSMEGSPSLERKLTTVIHIKGGSRVPDSNKFYRKSERIRGVKLQYCTEELGSESRPSFPLCDDEEEEKEQQQKKKCGDGQTVLPLPPPPVVDCYYPRHRQQFPPPLTIINARAGYYCHSSERTVVLKKSRGNGRLVLRRATEEPTHEYLRADRKDGHLRLHLAPLKKYKADSELERTLVTAAAAATEENKSLTTHRTSDDSVPMPSEIIKQMEFLDPPTPPSLPSSGRLNYRQRVAIQEGLKDYLAKLKKSGVLGGNNNNNKSGAGFCKSGLGRDNIRDYCYWEVHSACVATSS